MPYEVKKVDQGYKLWNISKKEYVNKTFRTRDTAISTGKNYMRYRKEKPYVKGNRILARKS